MVLGAVRVEDLGTSTLALLVVAAFVGGVGITALGPGGVLVTVALYAVPGLSPATVAGTAIATHVATGVMGTTAYVRSGHLRQVRTRRIVRPLVVAAVIGTPLGVLINTQASHRAFGVMLGGCVIVAGALVLWREQRTRRAAAAPDRDPHTATEAGIGVAVATASGTFGLGGPLPSVPLLVASGVPMLAALAAAQVQSIVIATVGTVAYALHGAISWPLVVIVGVPELLGAMLGARVAHRLPVHRLRLALAIVLLAGGVYMVARG